MGAEAAGRERPWRSQPQHPHLEQPQASFESCCYSARGQSKAVGRSCPEPSMRLGVEPLCSQHSHHPAVLSWALTNPPTVPVLPQERKRRESVSLPIVPIYSPKCWQDGCDLVTRFSSSSAPSHTVLPSGPLNPPPFPFPLPPLGQPSSTPSTLLPTAHPHPTAHPMAPSTARGCGVVAVGRG